jgi:hypothetical protein
MGCAPHARNLAPSGVRERGRSLEVSVEGPLTVNDTALALRAALDGVGIAYVFEEEESQPDPAPSNTGRAFASAGVVGPLIPPFVPFVT